MRTVFCAAVVALTASFSAAAELSLEEVIDKHIEALGGLETIRSVDAMKMTGKMTMGPMEMPIVMEMKRPQQVRMEFTMQGMTGVRAYDGETAWTVMPFMGKTTAEPMPADEARQMAEMADIDGDFVDWKTKGHQVELVGKEDLDGTDAYHLRVTKESGDVHEVYLDADYFLEISRRTKTTMQGADVVVTTEVGDYKEVGGLMLPHSMAQSFEGAPGAMTIAIENIELNPAISGERFAMPEAPAAEAAEG